METRLTQLILTTLDTMETQYMDALNELARKVYFCALRVHQNLGPGLLESAYEECLFYEIQKDGLFVEKQKPLPLVYEEVKLEIGYRLDLIVENKLILEIKAVEALNPVHLAQLLTYLKLSKCKLGLLMNFNVAKLKDGVKRVIL
jgi:GxxExxY protein